MSHLRRFLPLPAALALAAVPARAEAATISFSGAFTLPGAIGGNPVPSAMFLVPQFNPALGTPNAASYTIVRAGMQYSWAIDNETDPSTTVTTAQLLASTRAYHLGDELDGIVQLNSFIPPQVVLESDNDLAPDFAGEDAHTFQGVLPLATISDAIDPLLLGGFTGSGAVSLELTLSLATVFHNSGCCLPARRFTLPSTAVQWFWEYEYTPTIVDPGSDPAPVPEPATVWLLAVGAAALGWSRARRTRADR